MIIRPATLNDGPALLQLKSIHVRKNMLCVEKCPDYTSLLLQPNKNLILVAAGVDGKIIAAISAIRKTMLYRGKKHLAYLLGELKADAGYLESPLLFALMNRMMIKLEKTGLGLLFYEGAAVTGIGNQYQMISPDNSFPFQRLQSVFTYFLPPRQLPFKVKIPLTITGYDEEPLKNFYERSFASACLRPLADQLEQATHFTCTQNQVIKAALSVCDVAASDQQLVLHVPRRSSWSILGSIRRLAKLSSTNQPATTPRILTISHFGYEPGHELTLVSLLDHAMHFAWENKYQYLSISSDQEQELLNKLVRPLSRWIFKSTLMVSDRTNHPHISEGVVSAIHHAAPSVIRQPQQISTP